MEKTTQFQQRHKTMTFQLQAMEERSQQLNSEITEARDEIIGITSEIEKMRESRDQKLARINELQTKSQQVLVFWKTFYLDLGIICYSLLKGTHLQWI